MDYISLGLRGISIYSQNWLIRGEFEKARHCSGGFDQTGVQGTRVSGHEGLPGGAGVWGVSRLHVFAGKRTSVAACPLSGWGVVASRVHGLDVVSAGGVRRSGVALAASTCDSFPTRVANRLPTLG